MISKNYHSKNKMEFVEAENSHVVIHNLANEEDLLEELADNLEARIVGSAQWFRIADLWYRISYGYNNPLNFGSIHSELFLIMKERETLSQLLRNRGLVFFGVGVGDTEMALVDLQLATTQSAEAILIDINPVFLRMFVSSLAKKRMEKPELRIRYLGVKDFFERVSFGTVRVANGKCSSNAIVCLGGTIGNYNDTREIFDLFQRTSVQTDLIVVGYQLYKRINITYNKYRYNSLYRELIGNYLEPAARENITWRLNSADSIVEAWLDEVQIFRSRKFDVEFVRKLAHGYNWEELLCSVDSHKNYCIHVFRKK